MSNEDLGRITDIDESTIDRNIVETGIQRKKGNKMLNMALASIAGLVIFGLAGYYILGFENNDPALEGIQVKKDEALLNPEASGNSLAAQMEAIRKKQAEEERLRREAEEAERLRRLKEQEQKQVEEQQQAEIEARINNTPIVTGSHSEPQEEVMTPAKRRLTGNVLVQLEGAGRSSVGESDPDGIDSKLRGDVYSKGSAKLVRNLNLLLIHGTQIPCALQTRLVTDHPSILICQVTKNIYSADGSTLLIERGSKVFGEQKKAIITGQSMAFVNWSEIDTPFGIRVRIDSLGTDSLGASGINVWVDEKWGKRFGGAILLSFIQDALATASQRATNTTVVYENSEANTGRMAEIALENSINIQPTGYANQGQQINILVARDIDFSDIYKVK